MCLETSRPNLVLIASMLRVPSRQGEWDKGNFNYRNNHSLHFTSVCWGSGVSVHEKVGTKDRQKGQSDSEMHYGSLLFGELPEYRSHTILLWMQSIIHDPMNELWQKAYKQYKPQPPRKATRICEMFHMCHTRSQAIWASHKIVTQKIRSKGKSL